jgi:hypothetical protein
VVGTIPAPDEIGQMVDVVVTWNNHRDHTLYLTGHLEYPGDCQEFSRQ